MIGSSPFLIDTGDLEFNLELDKDLAFATNFLLFCATKLSSANEKENLASFIK